MKLWINDCQLKAKEFSALKTNIGLPIFINCNNLHFALLFDLGQMKQWLRFIPLYLYL